MGDVLQETSSAQYILQQYTAASGGQKLQNSIKNAYAMGKVRMVASEFETATKVLKTRNASRCAESGGFVLWQMNPDMWYVELAVGGSKVHAGCNGKLVWRHTPWQGAHTAKGPVRPLRRALQVEFRGVVHSYFLWTMQIIIRLNSEFPWISFFRVLIQDLQLVCLPMPDV